MPKNRVIKFLSKVGLAPAAIQRRLDGVYGEASPLYSTVKEWAKQFRQANARSHSVHQKDHGNDLLGLERNFY
jgi:hypothetical protein